MLKKKYWIVNKSGRLICKDNINVFALSEFEDIYNNKILTIIK
jgi:hypothetical protein